MKCFIVIAAGSLLAVQGLWMDRAAIEITDNALFRLPREGEELPPGREDLYFGPDSRVAAEMPQMKAQLKIACTLGAIAPWNRNGGLVLIALGAAIGTFRFLAHRAKGSGHE